MQEEPLDSKNPSREVQADSGKNILYGIVIANAFGLVTVAATAALLEYLSETEGLIVFSEFFLIPILMGIISAYFWVKAQIRTGMYTVWSMISSMIVLGWSWAFMGEGYICLIIVSPLLMGCMIGGAYLGMVIWKRANKVTKMSVLIMFLVFYGIDMGGDHKYECEVADTITINAPPDVVWDNVVAFEPIEQEPEFWMFQIGMPMPMETTVDVYEEGAGRLCIFNDSIIFVERMTTFEPGKDLTFEILEQPQDPEIIGHIEMYKGQFLLHDNGDGTTTLVGTSWYRLLVLPASYYEWWAESITRNVHLRVMRHVKELSEKEVASV